MIVFECFSKCWKYVILMKNLFFWWKLTLIKIHFSYVGLKFITVMKFITVIKILDFSKTNHNCDEFHCYNINLLHGKNFHCVVHENFSMCLKFIGVKEIIHLIIVNNKLGWAGPSSASCWLGQAIASSFFSAGLKFL